MIYTSPHSKVSNILGTSPEDIDTPKQGSDRFILVCVITLMIFGVLAVYSSIAYYAEVRNTTATNLVLKHIFKLGFAFIAMLIVSKINYQTIAGFSHIGMIFSWILLIAVMIYGTETFGAKRWLDVGLFSFQPSSLASVALLIHLSVLLSEKQEYIKDAKKTFLPLMFWTGITCLLIAVEDFSSAALLFSLSITLMFIGRVSVLQIGTILIIGALAGSILLSQSPVRQNRVEQYINQITDIESDEFLLNSGYQAQQAQIAIAKGELIGVGIGKSTQRDFLPAPYNDFIFAIIAEEYGMIGALLLILLFTLILFRGLGVIARKAKDCLGSLLATACTLTIVLYGFVNAGVASGLLPVTGLPMPFVSYGGTSMLFAGLMAGILLNISKHNNHRKAVFYA